MMLGGRLLKSWVDEKILQALSKDVSRRMGNNKSRVRVWERQLKVYQDGNKKVGAVSICIYVYMYICTCTLDSR